MKTIVHIQLSDGDRNDLARRLERRDTKRLVTRKEVIEHVQNFISQELKDARYETQEDPDLITPTPEEPPLLPPTTRDEEEPVVSRFLASRGDEDYLAQPKDADIAAACSRILDDAALIEQFAWDTVERNRSK